MKSKATINLLRKIRTNVPFSDLERIEKQIKTLTEKELGAFWFIFSSGYPAGFALSNFNNLLKYSEKNNISYKEAIKTVYTIYPGLNAGIFIKNKEWFEFN